MIASIVITTLAVKFASDQMMRKNDKVFSRHQAVYQDGG
jgi:hypothetical protein